ncbi:MAG: tRNA lysidine(34) synthetase TilS, partial [Planctomycetales bacterium]|nr:tRNA lysidine(34) synthetase TilS [Planctomycetales bacterium]
LEDQIQAAHFNHGWRGSESDADEAFVAELCQRLNVPLEVGRNEHRAVTALAAQTRSPTTNTIHAKTEENARNLRYNFLTQTAYQCGARYVLTAHTADDRVETLLHNLFRGTGLSGVVGPALTRSLGPELVLVRPLLGCWREQVEAYLGELGQAFRVDSSNVDVKFQRNYLRQALLPELRERFGMQLDERLLAFSELAEESVVALRELSADYLRRIEWMRDELAASPGRTGLEVSSELWLPTLEKLPRPWPVVHRGLVCVWQERGWPLQAMSREHWDRLRELLSGQHGQWHANLPGGLVARRVGQWVVVNQSSPR